MVEAELEVQMDIEMVKTPIVKTMTAHHLLKDQKVKGHHLRILLPAKTLTLHHLKAAATERSKRRKKMLLLQMLR